MTDEHKIQLSVKRGQDMVNVRANTANELQVLIEDLAKIPELSAFFGRSTPAVAETGVAEVAAQENVVEAAVAAPVVEPTVAAVPGGSPASTAPLSALEIARQRMRGGH
jgi:hypothetical protein